MKISDLAQKLNMNPTELRRYIEKLNIDIGKKARTIKELTAQEIIEKITAQRELLEATKPKKVKPKKVIKKKIEVEEVKKIKIPEVIMVKEFAARLNMPVTQVITQLIKEGIMASLNENIDFETAAIIAEDLGYKVKKEKIEKEKHKLTQNTKKMKPRPPVVVVMGHVDHGKTTLLDRIRSADVVATESGGITQHIGAYQVEVVPKDKKIKRSITFLDTPGHKAFTAMREHGAKITDIAVLVIAADDGVKPQTKEAADYAKAAGVPIIVAINKIDKPNADIQKTKKELSEIGLATEDWGGDTPSIEISAKTGKGVDELLELILLVADIGELKADPEGKAWGVVIEAHLDSKVGPVATVLVQKGELSTGDALVCGRSYGKVKNMEDYLGLKRKKAHPSDPVRIIGLAQVPDFGDIFEVFPSEKEARAFVEKEERQKHFKSIARPHLSVSEIGSQVKGEEEKILNIIIKADVVGSLEALKNSLQGLSQKGVHSKIIKSGVGSITENDVLTAQAGDAIILGFRTMVTPAAQKLARHSNIKISTYEVIYQLLDDVTTALLELVEPEEVEEIIGKAKILKVFTHGKLKRIVGGKVTTGKIIKDAKVNILSKGEGTGRGVIESLQKDKKPVPEVEEGLEFGASIRGDFIIYEGDSLEIYQTKLEKPKDTVVQ